MACPAGESGVPKLARKANYVELRFGPTTTPNETEQSHPSSVRLPRKLLCEKFPAIERFLNSPLNSLLDKKGDAEMSNVVDMAKLGVSFEEFVLVLHRCAAAPILTPEEEFALRKKHNLAGLDDVDLVKCSGKHFWETESAGVEEKEIAQKEVDSSVTSSSTSEDAADEGGGGGTGSVIGLDGPAMMSPESFLQDPDEAKGAPSTRSIYDLMSLFCVPGVEQDFIDVFFRGNIDCFLRDHGEKGGNGVKCSGTPLEPRLIPLHDASGVCRIKSDVKISWPDDVLLLHARMGWLRNGNAATKWCSENQEEGQHDAFRNREDANLLLNMVPAHLTPMRTVTKSERERVPAQPPAAHHRGPGAITDAIGAFLHKVVGASASSFPFHKDMRWALCGGNAYRALVRKGDGLHACDNAPSDYDLFLILPHILSLPLEERERAAQECATVAIERLYNELLALCGRPLTVHADDPNKGVVETLSRTNRKMQLRSGALVPQERLFLHCIQRTEYAVTFYVSSSCDPDFAGVLVPIQVVGWYSSVTAVLESFDIACCQVALDRGEFYATKKAVTALATGANVVNVNDLSPQYIYRLGKYFGRRMGIAVPLDRNFVVQQTQQSAASAQGIRNSSCRNYELGVRCLMSKLVRMWDEHLLEKMTAAEALWNSFGYPNSNNYPSPAEREELNTSHKQWRREHYSTWMQQTTIPERVALMVLQRQQNDSLAVAARSDENGFHCNSEDASSTRVRFPVHTLQTSDTVENVQNENFDLPPVFNHRHAANAGCILATGGSYLGNRSRFNTMEFRKAAASVEEGTSCGARLMGECADTAFAQHLDSLSKQKRTLTMFISDNLAHILRPESVPESRASDAASLAHDSSDSSDAESLSSDAESLDGANGVRLNGGSHSESETQAEPVLQIPLPSSHFPRTRKALMKMNAGNPDLVVPEKLRGCFRFKHRDGKGSFEKKDPKEVIEGGQWFTKNVHAEVDHVMRMILGLEEIY
eukprot:g592.t1